MITYEDECVSCGLPCLGSSCPNRNVPHFYCDECEDEADLFEYDEEQLCIKCIEERLTKITE